MSLFPKKVEYPFK